MVHKNWGKDIQQIKITSLDESITLNRNTQIHHIIIQEHYVYDNCRANKNYNGFLYQIITLYILFSKLQSITCYLGTITLCSFFLMLCIVPEIYNEYMQDKNLLLLNMIDIIKLKR